jgi:hypothetical protein
MEVWIPVTKESAKVKPNPSIASLSIMEASLNNALIKGINDQRLPKN